MAPESMACMYSAGVNRIGVINKSNTIHPYAQSLIQSDATLYWLTKQTRATVDETKQMLASHPYCGPSKRDRTG